jgi:hypothetical protein
MASALYSNDILEPIVRMSAADVVNQQMPFECDASHSVLEYAATYSYE